MTLDEKVFSIYTRSLLHTKNAMKRYKGMKDNAVANEEINMYDINQLVSATNLGTEDIIEYINGIK